MKKIGTSINQNSSFNKREDFHKELLRKLNAEREKIKLGGGQKAIEKHKAKGKLTARECMRNMVVPPVQEQFMESEK